MRGGGTSRPPADLRAGAPRGLLQHKSLGFALYADLIAGGVGERVVVGAEGKGLSLFADVQKSARARTIFERAG